MSRHTLPSQIDDTSRIIDAQIYLYYYAVYSAITTCTEDLQINAYMITEPWTWSGANNVLCNSTLPDYSERVLDYVIANETNVDANDESTYYEHFDITEAAQSWLDGKAANYGIFLRSKNPPSYENYVRFLTQRIEFLNQKIQYLTAGCAERRLSLYLISQIPEDEVATRLDISAVSLADLLDLGRASLYRAMDRLSADGFLTRDGHIYTLHHREQLLTHYS